MLSAILGDLNITGPAANGTTVDLTGLTTIYGEFRVNVETGSAATLMMDKLAYAYMLNWISWPSSSTSSIGRTKGAVMLETFDAEISGTEFSSLNLTMNGGSASVLQNPYLDSITLSGATLGDIYISENGWQSGNNGTRVDMSSVTVAGEVTFNNVNSLAAGKLATAVEMDIENNTLTSLSFPSLTQVQGYLKVNENPQLFNLTLGTSQYIPGLVSVTDNGALTTFDPFGPGVFGILGQGLTLQGAFET